MNVDDWQPEMQYLLEMFERESTISLRKISQCFVSSDHPFDEKFRQHFLKMSFLRLNTSFNTILFEQCFGQLLQAVRNSRGLIDAENGAHLLIAPKIEYNTDSGDELVVESQQTHTLSSVNVPQETSKPSLELNEDEVNFHIGLDLINENGIEFYVKREIKIESEAERETGMEDLPLVEFDPVEANERVSVKSGSIDAEALRNQSQMSSSSNAPKQKKKRATSKIFKCKDCSYATRHKHNFNRHLPTHDANAAKPFKCGNCDYACRVKIDLYRHQRVHADQKLIGVARDPKNGLYKCTHCTRNFTCFQALNLHLTKSHKTNRRLYNCVHCLRGFTRKTEKDWHEVQCRNRRYECYLCKNYVTGDVTNIQSHVRTHSGAKPFQCAICDKCFKRKSHLKQHLNSIHMHSHA